MNYRSLAALATVFGMAACNEIVTSPEQSGVRAPSFGFAIDNPPPPPSDLEAVGEVMFGGGPGPAASRASDAGKVSATLVAEFQFPLGVTYFFNKPGNSGWIQLPKKQDGGAVVGNAARVRLHKGEFLGDGEVKVQLGSGFLTFNLANVSQSSTFATCTVTAPEVGATARPEGGCFYVEINNAMFEHTEGASETVSVVIRMPCIETEPEGAPHPSCGAS